MKIANKQIFSNYGTKLASINLDLRIKQYTVIDKNKIYSMKNNYLNILLVMIIFGLSSCLLDDDDVTRPDEDNEAPPIGFADFDFSTTSIYDFNLELLNSQNGPVDGVLVVFYKEKPTDENGVLKPGIEDQRLFRGFTGANGKVEVQLKTPSYLDSVYIAIQHTGFPYEKAVALNRRKISLTLGGGRITGKQAVVNQLKSADGGVPGQAGNFYTLGTWNSQGVPDYLEAEPDIISNELLADINDKLRHNSSLPLSDPDLFTGDYRTNLVIGEEAEIWLTFVHEGAAWTNVIGYYTYPSDSPPQSVNDIRDLTLAFPNLSYHSTGRGGMYSGDKIQLKYIDPDTGRFTSKFPAGTNVGWFLVASGWNRGPGSIRDGQYTHYSNSEFNVAEDPELKKQVVSFYDGSRGIVLIGFEDTRRDSGSDHDFTDAVLYASVTPVTAVEKDKYPRFGGDPDSDNGGKHDPVEDYPDDPLRAFNNYYPSQNRFGSLLFEDLWPSRGDYDFNDMVIDYQFNQITNAENRVVEIKAKIVLRAMGAGYRSGFGLTLNTSPGNVSSVSGPVLTRNYVNLNANGTEAGQSRATIIAFDDPYSMLSHPGSGTGVNTTPGQKWVTPDTIDLLITFNQPVSLDELGTPPYNPFIIVNGNRDVEVHLPMMEPTDLADIKRLGTIDDDSRPAEGKYYVSDKYLPWAIDVPQSIDYPVEKVPIYKAFNHFIEWARSRGSSYPDWYVDKPGYRNTDYIYRNNQ